METRSNGKRTAVLAGVVFVLMVLSTICDAGEYTYDKAAGTWKGLSLPGARDLGAPGGMTGFKFDFTSSDHHIWNISTGYHYVDTQWGTLFMPVINYSDNCGQDVYNWELSRRALPTDTTIYHVTGSARGFYRTLIKSFAYGVEPVILGFHYWYANGDHHLKHLSVNLTNMGGDVWLETGFWDNCGSDEYYYEITYALVQVSYIDLDTGYAVKLASSSGHGYSIASISAVNPVLQSFELEFTNGDHHVDEIGIDMTQTEVKAWFNDTNDDDPFFWKISYVDLR